MKLYILAFFTSLFLGQHALANDRYYQIKEVKVREVHMLKNKPKNQISYYQPNTWGAVLAVTRDLVGLGQEVYKIVKLSEPQINTDFSPISVLPKLGNGQAPNFEDLELWRGQMLRDYQFTIVNMLNMEVVTFNYKVHFYYGGSYNSKGAYIKGFMILPELIHVMPGYDLDSTFKMVDMVNKGTSQDPLPAMTVNLKFSVDGPLDVKEFSHSFQATGNGKLLRL